MEKLISDEEYYSNLPKKHIGVTVLIFDKSGKLLLVNPTYKDEWTMPGGGVDIDETPKIAALREAKEETGLDLKDIALICVEYTYKEGIKPETLQFAFYGGELNTDEVNNIVLDKNEHSEFKFVEISEAELLLGKRHRCMLPFCIKAINNKNTEYIEFKDLNA
ncbi:MAG: NUDIX hydrolase [Patescibacteria group bacterium]